MENDESPELAHEKILARPCVLLDVGSGTLAKAALSRVIAELSHQEEATPEDCIVLSNGAKGLATLQDQGAPSAMTMYRALDEPESLGHAKDVIFYNPVERSPQSMDLKAMLAIMLLLKTDTRAVVVLDPDRMQAIWARNLLFRAGFVPITMVEGRFVEEKQPVPAASLGEALERLGAELAATRPELLTGDAGRLWAAHLREPLSDDSALALAQHSDGAVRAGAILRAGPLSELEPEAKPRSLGA